MPFKLFGLDRFYSARLDLVTGGEAPITANVEVLQLLDREVEWHSRFDTWRASYAAIFDEDGHA